LAIHRSFPETDVWSRPAKRCGGSGNVPREGHEKAAPEGGSQIDGTEVWLETLASWAKLGVSHFVLDFGHVTSTEPVQRFAEEVIKPLKAM